MLPKTLLQYVTCQALKPSLSKIIRMIVITLSIKRFAVFVGVFFERRIFFDFGQNTVETTAKSVIIRLLLQNEENDFLV